MFEIPDDDDDGFWEGLPLEELENKGKTEYIPAIQVQQVNKVDLISDTNVLGRSLLAPVHTNNSCTSKKKMMEKNQGDQGVNDDRGKPGTKRKFPGPAGALPSSFSDDSGKSRIQSPVVVKDTDNEGHLSSQSSSSSDVFSLSPWLSLMADIGQDAASVLNKFSIKAMLLKARKRALPKGKIPLVLAFIDSVDFHGCDGSVVLRDPSGRVQGALHQELIKDPTTALKAGCVIVLRQTSVISPSPRTNYLNITPANIVVIYSQTKGSSVLKSQWSPTAHLTAQPLPLMTQVIQESDRELTSALIGHRHRQDMSVRHKSHTGVLGKFPHGSSPFSTIRGSTHNMAHPQRLFSPVSVDIGVRSSSSSHLNHIGIPSKSTNQSYPTKPISGSSSSHHPSTLPCRDVSITAWKAMYQTNETPNLQSAMGSNNFSSSSLSNTFHPSNQYSSQPVKGKSSSPPDDEFLGDDSDLLSLCDDVDVFDGKTSHRNQGKDLLQENSFVNLDNVAIFNNDLDCNATTFGSSHSMDSSSLLNEHHKKFNHKTSKGLAFHSHNMENCNQVFESESRVDINSDFPNTTSSENSRSGEKPEMNIKDTAWSGFREQALSGGSNVAPVSCGVSTMEAVVDGVGRDTRIQLGKSKEAPIRIQPPSFETWDDDLSDDLLSQL